MTSPLASPAPAVARAFRGLVRYAGDQRLLVDTVLLGVAGALFAQLFTALLRLANNGLLVGIAVYRSPGLPAEGGALTEQVGPHGVWLIPVVTTLGGLVVGLLVERFAPEAEGHGTDAVIKAFHRNDGFLRARVPVVKLLASALTIGSGGVAGREGPMALITGGVGSWYATRTGRSGRERRLLLLVGMAAGLAAIFRSPIGAALLAVEIPYLDVEFEPGALLYTALGAIVAYAVNGLFVGFEPLFVLSKLSEQLPRPIDYGAYVLLGITAGILATYLPRLFYGGRDLFRQLPVPPWMRPAVGGFLTGMLALAVPMVVGGGYGWIQLAIDGRLALSTLAVLVVAKAVGLTFTVSSGGSGGVFAPTLFIGAMLGGALAALLGQPFPPFVIVGMAAVFAGAAHVPIATMMMVIEMTGGYGLLVPATFAVLLSYLVQVRLTHGQRVRGLYEAQVTSRADSPAHHERHLQIALQILRDKGYAPQGADDRALVAAMQAGIAPSLPGGRRLYVGRVTPESPLVGQAVSDTTSDLAEQGMVLVAILRDEHMLAPRPDVRLAPQDGVILLLNADADAAAQRVTAPW
ncbi:MAG: chloride channel protein [Gemmatimonadaceae bacterium]|nr:chloride channel protein [Gemmatimonadaceae bacterium]